jgi:hypothetical protein
MFAREKQRLLEPQLCFCMRADILSRTSSEFALAAKCFTSNEVQGTINVKEEGQMSHRRMSFLFTVLGALALALPITARSDNTNPTKEIVSMSMNLNNPVTLGGTELKPGSYSVKADSVKVTFSRGGKMIAEAPVQWKDEADKAARSTIVTESRQIKEIHFLGKSKYVEIAQ